MVGQPYRRDHLIVQVSVGAACFAYPGIDAYEWRTFWTVGIYRLGHLLGDAVRSSYCCQVVDCA